MSQLRELNDALSMLISYGSTEMKALKDARYQRVIDLVNASIEEMAKVPPKRITDSKALVNDFKDWANTALSWTRLTEFMFERADNYQFTTNKTFGPLRTLFNRGVQAEADYNDIRTRTLARASTHWNILKAATNRLNKKYGGPKFEIEGVPMTEDMVNTRRFTWTANRAIALVLNMGNAGNFKKRLRVHRRATFSRR
jgi:hypothetical protein